MAGKIHLVTPQQSPTDTQPAKRTADQEEPPLPARRAADESDNRDTCTPPLEVLQAALMYLMSRYARSGCQHLMPAIVQHLQLIHSHPQSESESGVLRNACARLANEWTELQYAREIRLAEHQRGGATRH